MANQTTNLLIRADSSPTTWPADLGLGTTSLLTVLAVLSRQAPQLINRPSLELLATRRPLSLVQPQYYDLLAFLALVVEAIAAGHSGVPLEQVADYWWQRVAGADWARRPLAAEIEASLNLWQTQLPGLIGGDAASPFVWDCQALYTARSWQGERQLAGLVADRLNRPLAATEPGVSASLVAKHLSPQAQAQADQDRAVLESQGAALFVLGGGPGTGKTTTVFGMLVAAFQNGHRRCGLAAPTGRAAQRLKESLMASLQKTTRSLPAGFADWLATIEAQTVHRYVGLGRVMGPGLIDLDVLIIDEASMVDTAMASAILAGLPATASLILVGDRHQLPSIDEGALLADLARLGRASSKKLGLELHISLRSAADLLVLPRALVDGTANPADWPNLASQTTGLLAQSTGFWPLTGDYAQSVARRSLIVQALAEAFATGPQALADLCVLSPTQDGFWGASTLNHLALARFKALRRQSDQAIGQFGGLPLVAGLPIMVSQNLPDLGVFNGDRGILTTQVHAGHTVWQVWFPSHNRRLPIELLPDCQASFAMTIHKSQGSEFERVIVCLGDFTHGSRHLLYTALTRSKAAWHLVASSAALAVCLERLTERWSRLVERIKQLVETGQHLPYNSNHEND